MYFRTLFIALFGLTPALLLANNPKILIEDPPGPATPITSSTFSFGADGSGGGVFTFENLSGTRFASIEVTATLPDLTAITCGPGQFVTCTVTESKTSGGWLYDILFGPTSTGGVPNGGTFEVDLNNEGSDPDGSGSWPTGQDFNAKVNATPEPASVALLLAGGALLGFSQRKRLFAER